MPREIGFHDGSGASPGEQILLPHAEQRLGIELELRWIPPYDAIAATLVGERMKTGFDVVTAESVVGTLQYAVVPERGTARSGGVMITTRTGTISVKR